MIAFSKKISVLLAFTFLWVTALATNPLEGKYILVIDIQEIWTKNKLEPAAAELLIANINKIISKADSGKVIYIESVVANLSLDFSGISIGFPKGLMIDDRLHTVNSNRFTKNKPDSFSSEQLKVFLSKHTANSFVVVGLAAEHCILETLVGGLNRGYKMALVPEAIWGESEATKEKSIATAKKKGAEVVLLNSL